jgi:hypothetical protein
MRRFALLISFCALAAIPAPALADDRSVYEAFEFGFANELKAAVDEYSAAARALGNANRRNLDRRLRRTIRKVRAIDRVLDQRRPRIDAEASSSPPGEEAKQLALRSDNVWATALRWETRALRAGLQRRPAAFRRNYRRSRLAHRRSARFAEQAYAKFREAGIQTQSRARQASVVTR